jgi:hypothetical protein
VVNAAVGWIARGIATGVRSMFGGKVGELCVSCKLVSGISIWSNEVSESL